MTTFQQTGLSITCTDSLLKSFADRSTEAWQLAPVIESYDHESRAIGGFYSASLDFAAHDETVAKWVKYGLGRHMSVKNPAGVTVWSGFANKISVAGAGLTFELGPLMGVANKVATRYSLIDNSVTPPIIGYRTATAFSSDAASQALYGILEYVLATSGATAATALRSRDAYLVKSAWPAKSHDFTMGGRSGGDTMAVTVDCLGYWHLLEKFVTYSDVNSGDLAITTQLTNVFNAFPVRGVFSSDFSQVLTNTFATNRYQNNNASALDIVQGLNELGFVDANGRTRTTNIGIYSGRQLVYEVSPLALEYIRRVRTNEGYTGVVDDPVDPWDVKPGKWIFFSDFLTGEHPPVSAATILQDPRTSFIETCKFSAPYGLAINGKKLGEFDQIFARAGLGGIA